MREPIEPLKAAPTEGHDAEGVVDDDHHDGWQPVRPRRVTPTSSPRVTVPAPSSDPETSR